MASEKESSHNMTSSQSGGGCKMPTDWACEDYTITLEEYHAGNANPVGTIFRNPRAC